MPYKTISTYALLMLALTACVKPGTVIVDPGPGYTIASLNTTEQKLMGRWNVVKEEDTLFVDDTVAFMGVQTYNSFDAPFHIRFTDTIYDTPPANMPQGKQCLDNAYLGTQTGPGQNSFLINEKRWWYFDESGNRLGIGTNFYRIWQLSGNSLVLRHEDSNGGPGPNQTKTIYFTK